MKLFVGSSALLLALLSGCASMPGGPGRGEHAAHHPPAAAAGSPSPAHETRMKAMQEMHQKMAAAKTPEERAALMKDHMKAMQDGMATMGPMHGAMGSGKGPSPSDDRSMGHRMDMMEMMMRMMLDREATRSPAPR